MPNYVYVTSIPAANNDPSEDQPNLEVNTNSINSILNVDMIGFNNNDGGYHQQMTYIDQVSNPGSSAGQYREFAKLVSGQSELFAQKDGVGTLIQKTSGYPIVNSTSGPVTSPTCTYSSFQTYLAGPLIIKCGTITASGNVSSTATFTSLGLNNFPNGILYYNYSPDSNGSIDTVSASQFSFNASSGGNVKWFIIGY